MLAMQLARLARATCRDLRKLRTTPRITLPWHLPERVRCLLQHTVVNGSLQVPTFQPNSNFVVSIVCGRVAWRHSPYLVDLLAPVCQPLDRIGQCSCHRFFCGLGWTSMVICSLEIGWLYRPVNYLPDVLNLFNHCKHAPFLTSVLYGTVFNVM